MCKHTLAALTFVIVFFALAPPTVSAWDSQRWKPTHPTHRYLTAWTIDQLKGTHPELETYRKQFVEGGERGAARDQGEGGKVQRELAAKRVEHKGTNEGCDDGEGWWSDARAAYRAGEKARAYFLLGALLNMVEDMGVPVHANKVVHQGNLTEFDNFDIMALSNWKSSFDAIDRKDPAHAEPWRYYHFSFSRHWTYDDAPDWLLPQAVALAITPTPSACATIRATACGAESRVISLQAASSNPGVSATWRGVCQTWAEGTSVEPSARCSIRLFHAPGPFASQLLLPGKIKGPRAYLIFKFHLPSDDSKSWSDHRREKGSRL